MVVPLRPGKFYGGSLPRPRIYTDVKFSDQRVDPPVPVLDPLMSWAREAHWSMGGLSRNRLRLQGKIEGNVKKLRKERENTWKLKMEMESLTPVNESKKSVENRVRKGGDRVGSPPLAPILKKRKKRVVVMEDEKEEEEYNESEEEEIELKVKRGMMVKKGRRRLVRKLGDDFELVVGQSEKNERSPLKDLSNGEASERVSLRTRSRRSMVLMEEEEEGSNDAGKKDKSKKKVGVENGSKVEKVQGKSGSFSPNGSRSSPRLKKKLG